MNTVPPGARPAKPPCAIAATGLRASQMQATTSASARFKALLDASDAAGRRFCSLPEDLETTDRARHEREEDAMCDASTAADAAVPTTWAEFGRWVGHVTDDGQGTVDGDNAARLLMHTRRLVASDGGG